MSRGFVVDGGGGGTPWTGRDQPVIPIFGMPWPSVSIADQSGYLDMITPVPVRITSPFARTNARTYSDRSRMA